MSEEDYKKIDTDISDMCEKFTLQTPTENNTAYFLQRIDGDLKVIAYYLQQIVDSKRTETFDKNANFTGRRY